MKRHLFFIAPVFFVTVFLFSCKKDQKRPPLVTTSSVSPGIVDAYVAGVLYSSGDAPVTEQGICYSSLPNTSVNDDRAICESGKKNFSGRLINLYANQRFFARAYAINKYGISYGKEIRFDTYAAYFPSVYLYSPFQNSGYVQLSLQISQDSPANYTLGVCWSKTSTPTINSNTLQIITRKTSDETPFYQTYSPAITNLQASTRYYFRAFVYTSYGILYSNEIYTTTSAPVVPVSFNIQSTGSTDAAS